MTHQADLPGVDYNIAVLGDTTFGMLRFRGETSLLKAGAWGVGQRWAAFEGGAANEESGDLHPQRV